MVTLYKYVRTIDMNLESLGIGRTFSDKIIARNSSNDEEKILIFNSVSDAAVFFRTENCQVLQYKDGSLYVTNIGGAIRKYWWHDMEFYIHDKLKVKQSTYGYYVDTRFGRCYINSLIKNAILFDKFPNTNGKPFVATFPKVAFFKRNKNRVYLISDFEDGERVDFNCKCQSNASTVKGYAWYSSFVSKEDRLTNLDELVIEV